MLICSLPRHNDSQQGIVFDLCNHFLFVTMFMRWQRYAKMITAIIMKLSELMPLSLSGGSTLHWVRSVICCAQHHFFTCIFHIFIALCFSVINCG